MDDSDGCGCVVMIVLVIIVFFVCTKGCDSKSPAPAPTPAPVVDPPIPSSYSDIHFDVENKPVDASIVTPNIWEMDCYHPLDANSWYWCYKASLRNFQNKHPNDKIVTITPSVYFKISDSMIPMKVFIITEPVPLPSPEIKVIPDELK